MTARAARIHLTPRMGRIELDGTDIIRLVQAVTVQGTAGEPAELTLRIVLPVVDVDGEFAVAVDDATATALVALGWTPPETQAIQAGQPRAWQHQCGRLVAGTDESFCPGCRYEVKPREIEARYILMQTPSYAAPSACTCPEQSDPPFHYDLCPLGR